MNLQITKSNNINKLQCKVCKKLLALKDTVEASFDIKCHRCGSTTAFNLKTDKQVIITDKNGVILSINKKTEDVTGYSLSEVIGKKPSIWGKQMPPSFYKNIWSDLLKKKTVTVNLQNMAKNGALYNVSLHIQPFLDKNNEIKFFLGEEVLQNQV